MSNVGPYKESMRNLTILSGAGINIGVSQACPFADEMLNFSYQKISTNVYTRISPEIKALFSPESFDYILGGLLTGLLLHRFAMGPRHG